MARLKIKRCEGPGCKQPVTSTRSNAKYHNDVCRKRAQRARPKSDAIKKVTGSDPAKPYKPAELEQATLVQLRIEGREATSFGIASLMAARRLDSIAAGDLSDTASGFASLIGRYLDTMQRAVSGGKRDDDAVEAAQASAAFKLIQGGQASPASTPTRSRVPRHPRT